MKTSWNKHPGILYQHGSNGVYLDGRTNTQQWCILQPQVLVEETTGRQLVATPEEEEGWGTDGGQGDGGVGGGERD